MLGPLDENVCDPVPSRHAVGAAAVASPQFGIGVTSPTQLRIRRVLGNPVWSISDETEPLSSGCPYAPIVPLTAQPGAVDPLGVPSIAMMNSGGRLPRPPSAIGPP